MYILDVSLKALPQTHCSAPAAENRVILLSRAPQLILLLFLSPKKQNKINKNPAVQMWLILFSEAHRAPSAAPTHPDVVSRYARTSPAPPAASSPAGWRSVRSGCDLLLVCRSRPSLAASLGIPDVSPAHQLLHY